MKHLGLSLLSAALLSTAACQAPEDEANYDVATLEAYRSALPTRAQLEASQATASTATLLGEPAVFPQASADVVHGINGAVGTTVDLLELITSLPPTLYNSETREFLWGPYQDDEYGYGAAYIREAAPGAEVDFEYAFLRGAGNDIATLTPIVYGGATPDPLNEDHGVGVTVWDMTAMDTFAQANDPNYDAEQAETGRFAALFAAGVDENNSENDVAFVVAVFRDAVFSDGDGTPVDLDYFYGHVAAPENTFDFVDIEAGVDVTEPADGLAEDLGIRMAFLDGGIGRAEVDAIGGSLVAGQTFDAVECWDTSLNQTFMLGNISEDGSNIVVEEEGTADNCGAFNATLDDLGVPRLEDVNADLLAALDRAASEGL